MKNFSELMSRRKPKIVVAMSGGVDSSVAAGLLVEQGYDVQGVSLRLWEGRLGPRVCSDHRGAKEIAEFLGIRHELLDLRSQFVETVVKPFTQEYFRGRTPNPCVACNRDFKLGNLAAMGQGSKMRITWPPAIMRASSAAALLSKIHCCAASIREKTSRIFCSLCLRINWRRRFFPLARCVRTRSGKRRAGLVYRWPIVPRARTFASAITRS